jgi:hypothetical protein
MPCGRRKILTGGGTTLRHKMTFATQSARRRRGVTSAIWSLSGESGRDADILNVSRLTLHAIIAGIIRDDLIATNGPLAHKSKRTPESKHMSLPQTDYFDANLPGASQTVRIASLYDAKVFVCRWVIRDRDPALKVSSMKARIFSKQRLALFDWLAAQIPTVKL